MTQPKNARRLPRYAWIVFLAAGLLAFLITWPMFPHDRERSSLLEYAVKIAIFVVLLASVSSFNLKGDLLYLLLVLPILAYLGFFSPRMTYLAFQQRMDVYYKLDFNFLYPGLVTAFCFAYRLGGGRFGKCMKLGVTGILLLFSGLLDLMWFVVNHLDYQKTVGTIPHIQLIIGHVPSLGELELFVAVNLAIIAAIHFLPLDRWIAIEGDLDRA